MKLYYLLLLVLPTIDFSDLQLRTLHQLIMPQTNEEAWEQIPWRTSLDQARREAAAAGKPLLLWEMDGHPLGCT